MFFNCNGTAVTLILLIASCWTKAVYANEQNKSLVLQPELIAQPNKCVALNEGRACFAKVNVTWHLDHPANICLLDSVKSEPLFCWRNATRGQYLYNMEASKDIKLSLILLKESNLKVQPNTSLAHTTINVSWLYKSNSRKRRWRLF